MLRCYISLMPRKATHKRLQKSIYSARWNGRNALVVELARDYLAHHPNDATVWLCLGHALTKLSRYEEAEQVLSVDLVPEFEKLQPDFWRERGELERQRGNLYEAKECFERALDADVQGEDLYLRVDLGYLALKLGHLTEGEEHFRRTLEDGDFESKGADWYRLGQALRAQGRIEEALDCFKRASTHNPKFRPIVGEIRELEQVLVIRLMRSED